jgi:hypothetical protein
MVQDKLLELQKSYLKFQVAGRREEAKVLSS